MLTETPQLTPAQAIDSLIFKLGGALDPGRHSKGPCELFFEHLHGAKNSLLGGMFVEYRFSLEQAAKSSACIPDNAAKEHARKILRELLAHQRTVESSRHRRWSAALKELARK